MIRKADAGEFRKCRIIGWRNRYRCGRRAMPSRMVSDQIEVGSSFDFIPVLQIMITKRMPEMKASREYLALPPVYQ